MDLVKDLEFELKNNINMRLKCLDVLTGYAG